VPQNELLSTAYNR
jgi:hypothetical protein